MFKLIRLMPFEFASNFASRLVSFLGPVLPRRKIIDGNLAAAFPNLDKASIQNLRHGMWENLARSVVEFVHLGKLLPLGCDSIDSERVTVITPDKFKDLAESGSPAIIFAAHLANWELMPVGAALLGLDIASVFRPPNNRFLAKFILKARSAHAGRLIATQKGAGYQIKTVLEEGGIVGQMVDQRFRRGEVMRFLGREAKTNVFPAKLARRFDCPVYGARVVRLPNSHFEVELVGPIELPRDETGQIDIMRAIQTITGVVESWVREHPEQWLWIHRRWD